MKNYILILLFLSVFNGGLAKERQLILKHDGDANLVGLDGKVEISIQLDKPVAEKEAFRIEVEVTDWKGRELASKVCVADTREITWKVSLDCYGPVTVQARLVNKKKNQTLASASLELMRLVPVPVLTAQQTRESSIGVNTHANAKWSLLKKMGIHWARDFSFIRMRHGSKPLSGKYKRSFMNAYRDSLEAGIVLLPCMQQTYQNKDGTGFLPPKVVANGYKELANAFPKLPYWEVENEYDTGLRKRGYDTVEIWGPFFEAVDNGLKQSDSDAKVVMNGRAGIYIDFTRELLESKYGNSFAVVNYHYYTGTVPPEISRTNLNTGIDNGQEELYYLDRLKMINDLAKKHKKEAWLTEIGYDVTQGPAVGVLPQAVFLVRAYLTARWAGTDKIFWYFDRDVKKLRGIFGSCGLYNIEGHVRPSGAAMAALSQETATATILGRVDLGGSSDAWNLVFEKEKGGYVVASWTVREKIPVPPVLLEVSDKALDMFGNEVVPTQLSSEVVYFHLEKLPTNWPPKLKTRRLSPALQVLRAGESATLKVEAPENAEIEWIGLPPGVSAKGYEVSVAKNASEQEAEVTLKVKGNGWSEALFFTLVIARSLDIQAEPYREDKENELRFTLNGEKEMEWNLSAELPQLKIRPEKITLYPGKTTEAKVWVPRGTKGPLHLTAVSSSGAKQEFRVVPDSMEVKQADFGQANPFPAVWPDEREHGGGVSFLGGSEAEAPQAQMVWSADGICMRVRIMSEEMNPGSKFSFWDGTNIELFVATDPEAGDGWNSSSHQFFFVPQQSKEGWQMSAGEWKRSDNIKKTSRDDARFKSRVVKEENGYTLYAFIPTSALNIDRLNSGERLAVGLTVRCVEGAVNDSSSYWWPRRKRKLGEGVQNWGHVRLIP